MGRWQHIDPDRRGDYADAEAELNADLDDDDRNDEDDGPIRLWREDFHSDDGLGSYDD
jgi:hypothetical protein